MLRFLIVLSFVLGAFLPPVMSYLAYPLGSEFGFVGAIAIPLDFPHRNIFSSYTYEANYNLPFNTLQPVLWENIEDGNFFVERNLHSEAQCDNCTSSTVGPPLSKPNETVTMTSELPATTATTATAGEDESTSERQHQRERRSLISRAHFYQMMQIKFESYGFPGKACLLRLICETNASELGQVNGVLGSVAHVLFSPSSSMNEYIPLEYYQAEVDGHQDKCEKRYSRACKKNPLDLISVTLDHIVKSLSTEVNNYSKI